MAYETMNGDAFYGGSSGVGYPSGPDTVTAPGLSAAGSYSASGAGSISATGAPAMWVIGICALALILMHLE